MDMAYLDNLSGSTRLLEIGTTVAIELTAGQLAYWCTNTNFNYWRNKQQARADVKQRKLKMMGQLEI